MTSREALVVGIDLGTSGCTVSVLDAELSVVGRTSASYRSAHPHPGWVEQDPEEWVAATRAAFLRVVAALGPDRRRIRAVAFSGATHVAVLTGADGHPTRSAIMWNDTRSAEQAASLAEHAAWIRTIAGNRPSTSWTLCHLMWLRDHELLAGVERATFMKDWVRAAFSDGPDELTDWVEAQGSLLFDARAREWSAALRDVAGLSEISLPRIADPVSTSGQLSRSLAREADLPDDIAIVVGSTDTATELLAAGAIDLDSSVVKLATAGNVVRVSNGQPHDDRILSYAHLVPGKHYWNSATSAAAASVGWAARELLRLPAENRFETFDTLAASSPAGANGLMFLPHLAGERSPLFDPERRGLLSGLTLRHTSGDIARAVMEGVAYSLRAASELYPPSSEVITLIGGGARSRVWPRIIADVFERAVRVAAWGESSVGTAMLAGGALELWSLEDAAQRSRQAGGDLIEPGDVGDVYTEAYARYLDVVAAASGTEFRDPRSPKRKQPSL